MMGELVALETQNMEVSHKNNSEDCVDFAAATTATLGVPSPSLSKTRSFDDSDQSLSDQHILRKEDLEEEAELLRVLKLSEAELTTSVGDPGSVDERSCSKNLVSVDSVDTQEGDKGVEHQNLHQHKPSFSDNCTSLSNDSGSKTCFETLTREESSKTDAIHQDQLSYVKPGEITVPKDVVEKGNVEAMVVVGISAEKLLQIEGAVPASLAKDTTAFIDGNNTEISRGGERIEIQSTSATDAHDVPDNVNGCDTTDVSSVSLQNAGSDSSSGRIHHADVPEAFTSSLDGTGSLSGFSDLI